MRSRPLWRARCCWLAVDNSSVGQQSQLVSLVLVLVGVD